MGGGRCQQSGHRSRDEHGWDSEAAITDGVGDGAIGSRMREHPRGDDKRGRSGRFDGSGRREMRVIGGGEGTQDAGEQGGRRERAGQGGEGEAAAVDANRQGQDGDAANGEMIRKTAAEKEKEKERVTHDAATEGRRKRRKRRKSRHRRSLSLSEEDDEEEEGEQGSPRSGDENDGDSGGGQGQNDRRNQRRTHEQWCRRSRRKQRRL